LIPTRASYRFGIPGISSLIKLMRCPLVTQRAVIPRSELRALLDAAGQVARGEQSLLIYPEGHRSRNGSILPFMKPGLRLFLSRARERPVYIAVVDGLGHLRTFADTALRLSGTTGRVRVLGPYNTPPNDVELDGFIDSLRQRMVETLAELRRTAAEASPIAPDQRLAF
jgi:1-acyl-sn-glycerol-3-phosphate acyltransferase